MTLGTDENVSHRYHIFNRDVLFSMKRYASPEGTATTRKAVTKYCAKSPANGVSNGLLLAKNEENGSMRSLPSS